MSSEWEGHWTAPGLKPIFLWHWTNPTAPIHKAAIKSDAFPFAGHTHYLASLWGGKALMILAHQKLRVALLTDHIPLAKVASRITPNLIQEKTLQLAHTLENDFGYSLPKIALLGLNPHAGDQGVIGSEDDRILKPAIEQQTVVGALHTGEWCDVGTVSRYEELNQRLGGQHKP